MKSARRRVSKAEALKVAAVLAAVAACDSGEVAGPPSGASLVIGPDSAALTYLGETVRFTARVTGGTGAAGAVEWSSTDESVVTVDGAGLVTAAWERDGGGSGDFGGSACRGVGGGRAAGVGARGVRGRAACPGRSSATGARRGAGVGRGRSSRGGAGGGVRGDVGGRIGEPGVGGEQRGRCGVSGVDAGRYAGRAAAGGVGGGRGRRRRSGRRHWTRTRRWRRSSCSLGAVSEGLWGGLCRGRCGCGWWTGPTGRLRALWSGSCPRAGRCTETACGARAAAGRGRCGRWERRRASSGWWRRRGVRGWR